MRKHPSEMVGNKDLFLFIIYHWWEEIIDTIYTVVAESFTFTENFYISETTNKSI